MMNYRVIEAKHVPMLIVKVNKLLQDGWVAQGGPVYANLNWHQAVVKVQ